MSVKTQEELHQELLSAVRSNGNGGKTTAADLRLFLDSLITELVARTEEGPTGAGTLPGFAQAPDDTMPVKADGELQWVDRCQLAASLSRCVVGPVEGTAELPIILRDFPAGYYVQASNGVRSEAAPGGQDVAFLPGTAAPLTLTVFNAAGQDTCVHAEAIPGDTWAWAPDVTQALLHHQFQAPDPHPIYLRREETATLVRQADFALYARNRANLVHPDRTRTYYPDHLTALQAARPGDVAVIPAPIADPGLVGNVAQLDIPEGVSLHTQGFPIGNPTSGADALTLRSGKGRVVGAGSVVYSNSGGSWGLGSYPNAPAATIDYDVEDLHFMSAPGTSAITLQGGARVRYRGNITAHGLAVHLRYSGVFSGEGTVVADGDGSALYANVSSQLTWSGKVVLNDRRTIGAANNSTIHLERCLVLSETRTPGATVLIDGTYANNNTIILTNATVLGTPGQPVIVARTVILRGTTVVVGTIESAQIIDERPASVRGTGGSGEASSALEFVFEPGTADGMVRTMGSRQAATYLTQQLQNVGSVSYKVNGAPVTLPFVVAAGNTLEVSVQRADAAQAALVTLQD